MTEAELDQCRNDATLLHSIVSQHVQLKREGSHWKGHCPFHDDADPSFAVYDDGRFHCFGCSVDGTVFDYIMLQDHVEFRRAVEIVAAERGREIAKPKTNGHAHHSEPWQPIRPVPEDAPPPTHQQLACDTLHEYCDAEDRLLHYVRRIEAKDGKRKTFIPLTFGTLNGKRGWHNKAPDAPRPLYRLNALSHADVGTTVLLCEGEKAADAAQRLFPNYVAMTWSGGANAYGGADLSPLQGRPAILWPDADEPGRRAMERIAKRLPQARILDTTGLLDGFDAADLEASDCDDPIAWLQARLRDNEPDNDTTEPVLRLRYGFDATCAQPMGKIVQGLLHAGSASLFYGPPKSGKSFLVTDLALAIAAHQGEWMGHDIMQPGPVLYVACEGHAGFWKRLSAAAKVHGWDQSAFPPGFILATGRPTLIRSDARGLTFAPDPSSILAALGEAKRRSFTPVAIFIDTVFRSFGAGNVNASPDMNVYLASVGVLTDDGSAVALVHHEIKSGGTPAGSVSLIGGADTIVHIWRSDDGARFWQVEMAKDDAETEPRAFTLDVIPIGLDLDGRQVSSCVIRDAGSAPNAAPKKRGRPFDSNSDTAVRAELIHRQLCELLADPNEGQTVIFHPQASPIRAVKRARLRVSINQAGILETPDSGEDTEKVASRNRLNLHRALNLLQRQRKVAVKDDWIALQ